MYIYNILFLFGSAFGANLLYKSQRAYNYRKIYYKNHERIEYYNRTDIQFSENPTFVRLYFENITAKIDETSGEPNINGDEPEKKNKKINERTGIFVDSPEFFHREKKMQTVVSLSKDDIEYTIIKNKCLTQEIFDIIPDIIKYLRGYLPEIYKYAYILKYNIKISFDKLYSQIKDIFETGLLNGDLKKYKETLVIYKIKYKSNDEFFPQIEYEKISKNGVLIIIAEEIPKIEYQIAYFLTIFKHIFTTEHNLYFFISFKYSIVDKNSYARLPVRIRNKVLVNVNFYRSWIESLIYQHTVATLLKLVEYPSRDIIIDEYISN
ncbi:hypothetical protein CWI39_1829p0010 [Hamiltosporidium magnivora]|uniref:Uncharacterized protein n=1 Tax=Hamiltosporidium magnivora TaxID=148818 RepID=A0A4Q9KZT7_9MICR|nr:hypothetical protein CWI39_1829p0010 [Hamiltosporidium magnivora]